MGEARPGQAEVVEHVIQRLAGDAHAERAHVGEVREAAVARLMLLAEDHLPLGTVLGPPGADPPLQSAPDAGVQFRVPLHQPPRTRRPGGCPDCSPGSAPPRSRRYRPEGPGRRRPRGAAFPERRDGSSASRYPVARLKPVFAAATSIVWVFFRIMKSLLWRSVMWRPGTPALSFDSGKPKCCPTGHRRQEDRGDIFARRRPETPVGLRPPSVSGRRLPSHPDCRASLILIVAPHSKRCRWTAPSSRCIPTGLGR